MANKYNKELIDAICNMFNIVLEIYEEVDGVLGEDRPDISCPECKKQTKNYYCAWDINKHVHFYCEHCKLSIMQ